MFGYGRSFSWFEKIILKDSDDILSISLSLSGHHFCNE